MSTPSKGVALVTGAGQGIGRAIGLRLAEDGFNVAVNDIHANQKNLAAVVEDMKAKGRNSCAVIADVSREDQVKSMIETVIEQLGGLDVMVANAGICQSSVGVLETTVEDWDRLFSVNARGTFLCYKHAGLRMVEQGRGGRIIGACSVTGKKGAPGMGAYSSSKWAIRGLTQSTAAELGKHGITVNAYAPGAIDTEMLKTIDQVWGKKNGKEDGEYYKVMDTFASVGYKGTPLDIASLVSYLASKEAHFITGQSVSVNGGSFFD